MNIFSRGHRRNQTLQQKENKNHKLRFIIFLAIILGASLAFLASPFSEKAIGFRITELFVKSTLATQNVIEITGRTGATPAEYVDATTEIKAAITSLEAAGGGIIYFAPGKYLVQETLEIPSNITIQGSGVGEQGPTMLILGNAGDLDATGMSLISILPGANNVVIKNIELRSMTPSPTLYPRYDYPRIESEQTTGIRMYGTSSGSIQDIEFENVKFVNFTYGIDVGSANDSNPVIENVKMRNVVSHSNFTAMRIKSLSSRDWDVQNFNAVEMGPNQKGIILTRTGKISFLQLSCASTLHDAELCAEIGQRSGTIYFAQAHVEGPAEGFRILSSSSYPIFLDNSAMSGDIEEVNTIYSFGNRFSSTDENYRLNFINNGTASTLYACGDVFTSGYPTVDETVITNPYPGLATLPIGCNFDITTVGNTFATGSLPYGIFDWAVTNAPSGVVADVKNFGAIGDGIADDTTAFRNALQATNGIGWVGKTIIVPAGRYKISDTLLLTDGMKVQGTTGSIIEFSGLNRPLFQVRAMASDPIIKRGIGLSDLTLTNLGPNDLPSNITAIDLSGNRGASSDHSYSNLNISNFSRGIFVHNDSGFFDNDQPQFDSISVRDVTLSNNSLAIEFKDQNASNWNFENVQILGMQAGFKGFQIDGGGHIYLRGLACDGDNAYNGTGVDLRAEFCISISRNSGVRVEDLTSSNMKHAFYGVWALGWTPFPVVIKNSDLTDGFYSAGKVYLLSISNLYPEDATATLPGSKSVFFNTYGSDDPQNVYPGNLSQIVSCGDIFVNPSGGQSTTTAFTGVSTSLQTCLIPVTNPTISPNGGNFSSSRLVTLTTGTSGASIRYTTDGSTPTSSVGTLYSAPFTITSTTTVKAIAYKSGSTDSAVTTATFTKNTSSGGGGGGGGGTTPVPTPTPTPVPIPTPNPAPVQGPKLVNSNGTYFYIQNGVRKGVTSPGILRSCGFDFPDATIATTTDTNTPQGALLLPCGGALVKSQQDPTVYLISNNGRFAFTSGSVFQSLGFSFNNVLLVTNPELQALPQQTNIQDSNGAHRPESDINIDGTIYWIDNSSILRAYPSLEVYNSWHINNDFSNVIPANQADRALPRGAVVPMRVIS